MPSKDNSRTASKSALRPSFIESILGKRPSSRAVVKKEGDNEDDNIVAKVESRDDNMIAFDEDKKKKGRRSDSNELPKSMIERYGSEIKLSKKEQKRL